MIVDSHCHLDYSNLYNQLDDVIKRAKYNQVKYLLTICTTLKSFDTIKLITDKYENVYGTFGIHPHETKSFFANSLDPVKQCIKIFKFEFLFSLFKIS